jgi:uncharacterized FlaG/YvyC family protein
MDFSTMTSVSSTALNSSTLSSIGAVTPKQVADNVTSSIAKNPVQLIKQINDLFARRGESLVATFEKDPSTGMNIVKIVDKTTNETISQLPIKEMVSFAQFLDQAQQGTLIHTTA